MIQSTVLDDQLRKRLFKSAMKGEWKEVIRIYKQNPSVHEAKITRSGQTALHIAVSDGQEEIVEELVNIINDALKTKAAAEPEASKTEAAKTDAFGVQDELGDTPLHAAATLGSVKMCECMAQKNQLRLGARNHDGETPFFLAALNGHKEAFLCLHFNSEGQGHKYWRRNDGDTILHCAISGDYFDLAFQIIHLYEDLVNFNNQQGFSPLHLLATKPTAFRSGSHLGRLSQIIYHCMFVDSLKEVSEKMYNSLHRLKLSSEKKTYYGPENYETCCNFITLLKAMGKVATGGFTDKAKQLESAQGSKGPRDPENPPQSNNIQNAGDQATGGGTDEAKQPGGAQYPQGSKGTQSAGEASHKVTDEESKTKDNQSAGNQENQSSNEAQGHQLFPPNYVIIFEYVKLVSKAMLIILGLGSNKIKKIREKKEKHKWSVQILDQLLKNISMYEYENDGRQPPPELSQAEGDVGPKAFESVPFSDTDQKDKSIETKTKDNDKEENKGNATGITNKETPILTAAKNGITEIVEKIIHQFPVAIHDTDFNKKNIVLLAVENRQPHVYQLLLKITAMKESVFRKVDNKGNSALHLAARLGDHKPWLIPGAALQMQWEHTWYEFVKESMPFHFFVRYNKDSQAPKDIFTDTHQELVKAGGEWLTNTSESCSVVAALIATVAFATSSTVPGGVKPDSGTPTLEDQPAFSVFAISSLVALCFSITAVIMFLSILTSRYQEKDFAKDLPRKLLVGLTSLFVSIASMLISFCAGHFFVLKDKLKYAAFPVYAVTCLPVTFFAISQFPLYFDLLWATFKKVPQRSYKSVRV